MVGQFPLLLASATHKVIFVNNECALTDVIIVQAVAQLSAASSARIPDAMACFIRPFYRHSYARV